MRFHSLSMSREARQWRFGIRNEERMSLGFDYRNKFYVHSFLEITNVIHLDLWFADFEIKEYRNLGFCDMHDWIGNIMLDPPLSGRPMALFVIVDKKIIDVVSGFQLPEHKIFPVKARRADTGEERNYFILQVLYDPYGELYYPETQFEITKNDEVISILQPGEIRSYDEYSNLSNAEREKGCELRLKNWIYRKYYDVIVGYQGQILFSEGVRDAFSDIDLKGVYFEAYKYDILFNRDVKS